MSTWLHSALSPAGPQAARIDHLWWTIFWICAAVFVAVVVTLAIALMKGKDGRAQWTPQHSLIRSVGAATVVTVLTLGVLLIVSAITGRAMMSFGSASALEIQITGYQWWWSIEYLNPQPSLHLTTANEVHIPTGQPVFVRLKASDVIHSFWIPNLQGKTDLIPGRTNGMWLQADRPGLYYGQCAEFCGAQHAHMALLVIAESPQDFDAWLTHARQTAQPPPGGEPQRGFQIVQNGPCMLCHAIQGTTVGARTGPDLTHIASRQTLGAGLMANTPANLEAWLKDPQQFKPGAKMPNPGLTDDDRRAVVAFLETLR